MRAGTPAAPGSSGHARPPPSPNTCAERSNRMAKPDASAAVSKLLAAYGKEITQETMVIYIEKLADIPREVLDAAVDAVIESQRFFPAISEIRHAAARLA